MLGNPAYVLTATKYSILWFFFFLLAKLPKMAFRIINGFWQCKLCTHNKANFLWKTICQNKSLGVRQVINM